MLGDKNRESLAKSETKFHWSNRAFLHQNDEPIYNGDCPMLNPQVKASFLDFGVKYKPMKKGHLTSDKYDTLILFADFYENGTTRFSTYESLVERAKEDPWMAWILRNTDLDAETVKLAKENLGIKIPVHFKFKEYREMLREKIKEQTGSYPEYSVFMEPFMTKAEEERLRSYINYKRERTDVSNQKMAALRKASKEK